MFKTASNVQMTRTPF